MSQKDVPVIYGRETYLAERRQSELRGIGPPRAQPCESLCDECVLDFFVAQILFSLRVLAAQISITYDPSITLLRTLCASKFRVEDNDINYFAPPVPSLM